MGDDIHHGVCLEDVRWGGGEVDDEVGGLKFLEVKGE